MIKKIVSVLVIATFLFSCKESKEKTNPIQEDITESVYASGLIKSTGQYEVFSPVNGLLLQQLVKEGDKVNAGEPVLIVSNETAQLQIDNATLIAMNNDPDRNRDKLNELKSGISQARSKMKNDSLLLQKQKNLWAQEIGTRNELDQRELAYRTSADAYDAAVSRYKDLQKQIDFSSAQANNNLKISKTQAADFTIKSKIAGKVYSVLKKPGEMVSTQSPVAVIGQADNFIIELQVDEYDLARIKIGQKVVITMDSYKNKSFEAVVTRVIPYMNERTRSFTIEAVFTTAPELVYPNITVEGNIIIQTKEKAITIPRAYLISDSLVLMEGNKKQKVETGLKDFQKVEILSGLKVTDIIVKPGQ